MKSNWSVCLCGGLVSPRPAPHLAAAQSRLPLWPNEQLSPPGTIEEAMGGSPALQHGPSLNKMSRACVLFNASAHRDGEWWRMRPQGHWRSGGQTAMPSHRDYTHKSGWGVTRGRLCHQSEKHPMGGNACKCATLPVGTCHSRDRRRLQNKPPFWIERWLTVCFSQLMPNPMKEITFLIWFLFYCTIFFF